MAGNKDKVGLTQQPSGSDEAAGSHSHNVSSSTHTNLLRQLSLLESEEP